MSDVQEIYQNISRLLEENNPQEASVLLAGIMEAEGFNDTSAIFAATINAMVGDMDNYLVNIDAGLSYNPGNYELHLMRGNYYSETNVSAACDEYEIALAWCGHSQGADSDDYAYISDVLDDFKRANASAIRSYTESLPILIYRSEEVCYGILNHFADCLAEGLVQLGCRVEIIDAIESPPEEFLPQLTGRRYRAILGVQTYLFSVKFNDGRIAHDFILGPKYNMLFDHPACMYKHFTNSPRDFCVLTHDRHYTDFIKRYYKNVKNTLLFPPAGEEYEHPAEKKYGITFMGTYHDPKRWAPEIEHFDRIYDGRVKMLVRKMTENPNDTYEDCLRSIFGEDAPLQLFFDLKPTYFYVMSKYREDIISSILDGGIKLHVFGDSWNAEKWRRYPNLLCHPEVSPEDSILVYAESLLSLNIMSWHKDGRTERVANMMLNHSVVVSDGCDYLRETYIDGQDIVLFDLKDIDALPKRISLLLSDEAQCAKMAGLAYKKAVQTDVWDIRAKQFMEMICEDGWVE